MPIAKVRGGSITLLGPSDARGPLDRVVAGLPPAARSTT